MKITASCLTVALALVVTSTHAAIGGSAFGDLYDDPELQALHEAGLLQHVGPEALLPQHLQVTASQISAENGHDVEHPEAASRGTRHDRHRKLLEGMAHLAGTDTVEVMVQVLNVEGKDAVEQVAVEVTEDISVDTPQETVNVVAVSLQVNQVEELMKDPNVGFIEADSQAFMAGWANNVANSEWEAYGMLVTQGLRADIPLTDKFGACSDSTSFKVAIIDSGLRADHPDVPCRIQESESNCIGKSFGMNETENPWHSPWNTWHGTHVFGPMGAIGGNGKGVTSMNPTDNNICWIIARTFPDEQSPNGVKLSDVYAGVNWALQQGAQVINMSLVGGYTETGQATMDAAAAAGAIVVASSGNSYTWQYEYPSSYESVLSVGAIGTNKKWAKFSTCNLALNIAGPGVSVWSLDTQDRSAYGPYRYASGTSMAAPHVSGAIARVWSACPACSSEQVTDCVLNTSVQEADYPWCYGTGLLQVEDAYQCLATEKQCCTSVS